MHRWVRRSYTRPVAMASALVAAPSARAAAPDNPDHVFPKILNAAGENQFEVVYHTGLVRDAGEKKFGRVLDGVS